MAARQPVGAGVFLTHGEGAALAALATRLHEALPQLAVTVPALDDRYTLLPDGPRPAGGRERRLAPGQVGGLDWHNERSRLILELSDRLEAAPNDAARAAILQRLRGALNG